MLPPLAFYILFRLLWYVCMASLSPTGIKRGTMWILGHLPEPGKHELVSRLKNGNAMEG